MPIFEYRCDSCGTGFEELVFASTKVACPSCHGSAVSKRLSVPAPPVSAASKTGPAACEAGLPSSACCGGGACHQH
jgi:putative FmdB family regulatory protein